MNGKVILSLHPKAQMEDRMSLKITSIIQGFSTFLICSLNSKQNE